MHEVHTGKKKDTTIATRVVTLAKQSVALAKTATLVRKGLHATQKCHTDSHQIWKKDFSTLAKARSAHWQKLTTGMQRQTTCKRDCYTGNDSILAKTSRWQGGLSHWQRLTTGMQRLTTYKRDCYTGNDLILAKTSH